MTNKSKKPSEKPPKNNILQFLINDIKTDIKTIKAILKGNAQLRFNPKTLKHNIKDIIKTYYPFYLLLITAIITGAYLASLYYSLQCTEQLNTIIQAYQGCGCTPQNTTNIQIITGLH